MNFVTEEHFYYISTLNEILVRRCNSNVISKLDLAKEFYQETAFVSPFGKFEFFRMLFGLRNAPSVLWVDTLWVVDYYLFHKIG